MKKISTQPIKKSNSIKRLPSTTLKTDDTQDTKKKPIELTTKSNSQVAAKKATQSYQPVSNRTKRKLKPDIMKQRVITNTKASITQLKKQAPAKVDKSSIKNVPQPKKPLPGNFNVTVNSPPSTRKPTAEISKLPTPRDRTRTRTLKPEEVTVLKQIPHISPEMGKEAAKTPISFNINFESSKSSSSSNANTQIVNQATVAENDDDDQYESEFESYESDFESGSSKKSCSPSQSSSSSESFLSTNSDSSSSSDEEHGKSQTNIEQKLDSGNYDMKMKQLLTINKSGSSVINEPKIDDNQPDSGMNSGMFENHSVPNSLGLKNLQKRYADILEKIAFNTMEFQLYEDQPAPYEYFVKNYGRPRDVQNYTQTETDTHSNEAQTDNIYYKSAWVQHPPQFSLSCLCHMTVDPERFFKEKLGVAQENFDSENSLAQQNDKFSNFLENLQSNKLHNICKTQLNNIPIFKLDGLQSFLNRSLHAIEAVLVRNAEHCDKSVTKIVDLNLKTTPFNSTVTSAHYDSKSRHVLLTFHECNVEKALHRYVISVWDTRNGLKPKVILSCWSIVICTELIGPIILGGTTDGTVCLWDMENNNEELAAPLQLIACNQPNDDGRNCHYGSIVAVRSSNEFNGCSFAAYQVITLFEAGVLITWSISRAKRAINSDHNCDLNTIFHHAKFQLIQQNIINLHSMVHHRAISSSSIPASRGDSFQKGSLEDLLYLKNSTNDEGRGFDLWSNSDMQIFHNKAFVLLDRQIIVVNYLEPKCTLVMKNHERTLCLKKHPIVKEFMFSISSDNLIKVLKIQKTVRTSSSLNASAGRKANQQYTQSSMKHSPVLNKSCAIQNIVKNERKLYHELSSHADGLSRPLSSHLSENSHITQHSGQRTFDQVALYHNQSFFLRELDQRNPWLQFLSRGQVLCIGLESKARFIDLKTGQESYLSDYIGTLDAGKRRLLGTTDKHMIITTDKQGIYLYDISSSFKNS